MNSTLEGKELQEVVAKYGNSYSGQTIQLHPDVLLYEYQSDLYRFAATNQTIEVRELIWINNEQTRVVWFVLQDTIWMHLDNLEWSKDVQF